MKLKINLNKSDIPNTIKQLERYKSDITHKINKLAERLAEEGYKIATSKLYPTGIGTFENDRIYINEMAKNKYSIVVESKEILFLEFGAGIKHSGTRYPQSDEFGYGAGTYPGKGHWNNPDGWWYRDESGNYVHSYGNPPYMPMHDTAKELRERIQKIIKEVFGND